ncbi:MAG: hypothetical protein ABFD60_13400 [Bryobacteraceae bacterium]
MTPAAFAVVLLFSVQQPTPTPTALRIVATAFHQMEDGPAVPADHKFVPGETVYFSCKVQGYKPTPEHKVQLGYKVDAMDSDRVLIEPTSSGIIDTEVGPEDKEWSPKVRRAFMIPPHALGGDYKLSVEVKDQVSGQTATAEAAFHVTGARFAPSDALTVRDFHFFRSEEDKNPLPSAAYRPGNTLWAKFDIVGFKTGEKNRVKVEYGIAILSPSGKQLFAQPQAAVEEDSPFYPKRHVPGALSLNIQPGTPPGDYTLVVLVRDELGSQNQEVRRKFRIEP